MHKDAILQGLNDTQRQAVLHGEGPALVAAGPGSGKTFVITRRLLYLIQECNVPPEKILVITFTKEAAKTMQERFRLEYHRLKHSYQTHSQGFVNFGTFHSFFYQILRSISKYSEYQLITQQEKVKIAKEILQKENSEEVIETELMQFLTEVSFYKNAGDVKAISANMTTQEREAWKRIFLQNFEAYEALKQRYKRVDFDDMLYLCRMELMYSKDLLQYWQSHYSYILVDESQDMNAIQYELLKLLACPPYNLFLVGDDDQAIYGFRGSKAEIFQDFIRDFPGAIQICLNKNYRCAEIIVDVSKRLIEHNKSRVAKKLVSAGENVLKGKIQAYGAVSTKESFENVISKLREVEEDVLNNQAVLFRTNFAMQTFATKLSVHNIPFVIREKTGSIYEHFVVKDILDYFRAASGERGRSLFIRIFQKFQIPLGREALRSEQVRLPEVKNIYSEGFYENRLAYEEIEALERHLNRLAQMTPRLGMKYILHAIGYQNYLLHKCRKNRELFEEWQQVLDWLTEDVKDFGDFQSWEKHIQTYKRDVEINRENHLSTDNKKGVHLLTLHAAKGLEFQKVYIMNLNEGTIPQLRRGEPVTEERLEEERRIFYVGMTRAKEELELHYVTGTKENPKYRSRFLEELELAGDDT